MSTHGDVIREALAHMAAGPPDNGVSHRRALHVLAMLEDQLLLARDFPPEFDWGTAEDAQHEQVGE